MEIEYYDVTSELDARAILRYLNNMGIQNISGEVLKYFITDLKKLIKYDLQQKQVKCSSSKHEPSGPERLHSASTFSSRTRSRCQQSAPATCRRECQKLKPLNMGNIRSAPILGQRKIENNLSEKPFGRVCSCVKSEKKENVVPKEKVQSSNTNLIKIPKQPIVKKCDPVSLYHHYTSLWAKYKPNVPGENDWAELRWNVRQKMAGNVPKSGKILENHKTEKLNCMKK